MSTDHHPTPTPVPGQESGNQGGGSGSTVVKILVALFVVGLLGAVAIGGLAWYFLARPGDGSTPEPGPELQAAVPLFIDAAPWGVVVRITDEEGRIFPLPVEPVTPLTVPLPPGRYTVELQHPLSEREATCDVQVAADLDSRCRVELMATEAMDYFTQAGWGKGGGGR